jgi:hypothetical protein
MRSTISLLVLFVVLLSACTTPHPSSTSVTPGVPASWTTQWMTAQQAATAIDPAAIVDRVQAAPSLNAPAYAPLEVSFLFIRPNSDLIGVSFTDTDVNGSLTIKNPYAKTFAAYPSLHEQQRVEHALASVQISPSQALVLTNRDAEHFAQQFGQPDVSIGLHFDQRTQHTYSRPAVWTIHYIAPQTNMSLQLWIDPITGSIIDRVEGRL